MALLFEKALLRLIPAAAVVVVLLLAQSSLAGSYLPRAVIDLGPAEGIALDQPRVAVEVFASTDGSDSLGPSPYNSFLLDTGAQGILLFGLATDELITNGYTTEGTFLEYGVGPDPTVYDVSAPYRFDFAGSDGERQVLADARLLSTTGTDSIGGFHGIVGMPGMMGRVTTLDMSIWSGALLPDLMGVDFSGAAPASNGHRYGVELDMVQFGPDGDPPLPSYGPLPFARATTADDSNLVDGQFVLDTGAQLSIISEQIAFSLGLDRNGDGDLFDDAEYTTQVGGIGGTVDVPVMAVERLLIPTSEGPALMLTDLQLIALDIDPRIDGVLGSDILTNGWINALFGGGVDGSFQQVHFDFVGDDASMLLDLSPHADESRLPGDLDGDGLVSLAEAQWVVSQIGEPAAGWDAGDFGFDGQVDFIDAAAAVANLGETASAAHPPLPVPEPAALLLLGVAALSVCLRRRDRT